MKKRNVLLTTEAHRPAFDAFADAFRAIQAREGWRGYEVLSNWLEAAYRAMRGALLRGDAWQKNEDAYMAIVRKCRNDPKATMADICRMTAALTIALEAEPLDFVGPVFSELASDGYMGQFFTPKEVSVMMARMILSDAAELTRERVIFCCEPAVGVGGMVLASNHVLREQGVNVSSRVHWQCTDIDFRAVCGAYVQLNLTGASADVIHGDTLRLEAWQATPTMAAIAFPKRRPERAEPVAILEPLPIREPEIGRKTEVARRSSTCSEAPMAELRQRQPRIECPAFLSFLRTWPCVNCGAAPPTQAAHIRMACPKRGKRESGKGEKPDDRWAIPLCADCHLDGARALHKIGEKRFFQGWDPFAEATRFFLAFRGLNPDVIEDNPRRRRRRRKLTTPRRTLRSAPRPRRTWPKGRWPAKGTRKVNWRKP